MKQMERNRMNMQHLRNKLDVMKIGRKIEESHLMRIGHIARMSDERLVKQTTMGWISRMETGRKPKKNDDAYVLAQTIEGSKYRTL